MTVRVGLERRQIDDGEFGHEVFELRSDRADQQLPDEQRMPCILGVDPGLDPVFRISAAVEVLGVELLATGVLDEVVVQQHELRLGHLAVAVPPDRMFGLCIDDGVLVLGRAAGVDPGLGAKRAACDNGSLAVADGMLVKRGFGQVPVNRGEIVEAELVGTECGVTQTGFFHGISSSDPPAAILGRISLGCTAFPKARGWYPQTR